MRISILKKMMSAVAILIGTILLISVIGFLSIVSLVDRLNGIVGEDFPNYGYIRDAAVDIHQLLIAERGLIESEPGSGQFNDFIKSYNKNLKQSGDRFSKFFNDSLTVNERDLLKKYNNLRSEWIPLSARVVKLASNSSTKEQALALSYGQAWEKFDVMEESLDGVGDGIRDKIDLLKDSEIKAQKKTILNYIILVFVGLFISISLGLIITIKITNNIKNITLKLSEVASGEGDLTKKIDISSNDELGDLSRSFNLFVDKMLHMVIRIKESSSVLLNIKDSLGATSEETAAAVNEISSNVKGVGSQIFSLSNKIGEATTIVNGISNQTENLEGFVDNETRSVEESSAAINQMTASLSSVEEITKGKKIVTDKLVVTSTSGGEKLSATTDSIQRINEVIAQISEMVTVIDGISSQTNLLAMNAAIEAAHAGDAGKGFSVVADEIRKLAESSSDNSQSIAGVIGTIVQDISIAYDAGRETDLVFAEIRQEINDVSMALSEISVSTTELAAGSNEIQQAMLLLKDISNSVREATDEMKAGTVLLAGSMETVNRISSEASSSIGEITQGTENITQAMNQVNSLALNMGEAAERLDNEISLFVTE